MKTAYIAKQRQISFVKSHFFSANWKNVWG